jgi:hypothetical protein
MNQRPGRRVCRGSLCPLVRLGGGAHGEDTVERRHQVARHHAHRLKVHEDAGRTAHAALVGEHVRRTTEGHTIPRVEHRLEEARQPLVQPGGDAGEAGHDQPVRHLVLEHLPRHETEIIWKDDLTIVVSEPGDLLTAVEARGDRAELSELAAGKDSHGHAIGVAPRRTRQGEARQYIVGALHLARELHRAVAADARAQLDVLGLDHDPARCTALRHGHASPDEADRSDRREGPAPRSRVSLAHDRMLPESGPASHRHARAQPVRARSGTPPDRLLPAACRRSRGRLRSGGRRRAACRRCRRGSTARAPRGRGCWGS